MLKLLLARIQQGNRTVGYPDAPPALPDRFRGAPALDPSQCPKGCAECADACPTGAIAMEGGKPALDMGRCLFCTDCARACPHGGLELTHEYRLAARARADLVVRERFEPRAKELDARLRSLFGRSLKLRQVSAGGCNACEADVNVLGTVVFDLGRFGIQMVASPRHADGVLVTGPVTQNMALALQKVWAAIPGPKVAIAVGACAISGGPYVDHTQVRNGAGDAVPIDLFVPGCPPHPYTILDGLLGLIGRLEQHGWADRFRENARRIEEENRAERLEWARARADDSVKYFGARRRARGEKE